MRSLVQDQRLSYDLEQDQRGKDERREPQGRGSLRRRRARVQRLVRTSVKAPLLRRCAIWRPNAKATTPGNGKAAERTRGAQSSNTERRVRGGRSGSRRDGATEHQAARPLISSLRSLAIPPSRRTRTIGSWRCKNCSRLKVWWTNFSPDGRFGVMLDNQYRIIAYTAGKMRRYRIRSIVGDRVHVEMTPYDLSKGRIVFREKIAGVLVGAEGARSFRR